MFNRIFKKKHIMISLKIPDNVYNYQSKYILLRALSKHCAHVEMSAKHEH